MMKIMISSDERDTKFVFRAALKLLDLEAAMQVSGSYHQSAKSIMC
jgi:hypothetical protein